MLKLSFCGIRKSWKLKRFDEVFRGISTDLQFEMDRLITFIDLAWILSATCQHVTNREPRVGFSAAKIIRPIHFIGTVVSRYSVQISEGR